MTTVTPRMLTALVLPTAIPMVIPVVGMLLMLTEVAAVPPGSGSAYYCPYCTPRTNMGGLTLGP